MPPITLSPRLHAADPALLPALGAGGLAVAAGPRGAGPAVLHASEADAAGANDVVVELAAGAPALRRRSGRQPALVRFGAADRGFGHALVAELVRPAHRPAAAAPASAALLALGARVAASGATALILGETGTGKEGVARFMHAASPRSARDFIAVNCAALPDTMLEAMLFGHQKGSFTGAGQAGEGLFRAADGGTLFLDEVAELPLPLQAKLLRAIQEREVLPVGATRPVAVDVRLIAAANRDLAAEVEAGRFRADLYWRLNVLPVTLTPLRERPADVPALLAALLLRHAPATEPFPWPTADAVAALAAHDWPGNVRELENIVQRAILLRGGERVEAGDLALAPVRAEPAAAPVFPQEKNGPSTGSGRTAARLADVARRSAGQAIADALAAAGGNRVRAAGLLGISERTLRYRLAGLRADASLAAA